MKTNPLKEGALAKNSAGMASMDNLIKNILLAAGGIACATNWVFPKPDIVQKIFCFTKMDGVNTP